jgi:Peptidase family M23
MTTKKLTHSSKSVAVLVLTLVVSAAAAGLSATAHQASASRRTAGIRVISSTVVTATRPGSYDWPVKPFDRQHPVRGFLNDPRIGAHSRAFHFGIDIAAPDGTAVYAVEAGTVYVHSPSAIAVATPGDTAIFGYWHIVSAVRDRQFVRRHQLLGWIGKSWGHVHFAEKRNGEYVNPLRPGGLGPYRDPTAPTIAKIGFSRGALVVVAYDSQSPRVPGAWAGEPLTPALLRWRVVGMGPGKWHTAVDFRATMLPASRFDDVYAPATRQNHKGVPGRFSFYLARGERARTLARNAPAIEVEARDTTGNRTVSLQALNV